MKSFLNATGIAAIFTIVLISQGQQPRHYKEQRSFSAEDEGVQRPVAIPAEVLSILAKDNFVKNEMQSANVATDKLPPSWFSASEIHLAGPNEKDLIVVAAGPLVGANVDTFWVFVCKQRAYSLALTVPAHDLIVKNSRSRGYRNIEVSGETAVTITTVDFLFDGNEYKEYSEKTEDIK